MHTFLLLYIITIVFRFLRVHIFLRSFLLIHGGETHTVVLSDRLKTRQLFLMTGVCLLNFEKFY